MKRALTLIAAVLLINGCNRYDFNEITVNENDLEYIRCTAAQLAAPGPRSAGSAASAEAENIIIERLLKMGIEPVVEDLC